MTDLIITSPITIRRPSLPRVKLPKFDIAATLADLSQAMGQAFYMAYVTPYRTSHRQPLSAFDADLEGRDPNW
jgi:hypothetical protein